MIRLPSAGREYLTFAFDGLPADPAPNVEVQFPPATSWHALTMTGTAGTILVAGPTADATGAVVLPLGRTLPVVRVTDNPEIIMRGVGLILVS